MDSSRLLFDYEITDGMGTRRASEVHELGVFTIAELLQAFRNAGLDARSGTLTWLSYTRRRRQGESDFTGPNVVHWHGAAPTQPLVHVAVGFGGDTKWLEKVTDEQYLGKAK